jgi:hypothetical protein
LLTKPNWARRLFHADAAGLLIIANSKGQDWYLIRVKVLSSDRNQTTLKNIYPILKLFRKSHKHCNSFSRWLSEYIGCILKLRIVQTLDFAELLH